MRNEASNIEGATHDAGWRDAAVIFSVTLLLMLWPLAINRAPFYSADSASYLHGGEFGFNTGLLILDHWWQSLIGTAAPAGGGSADPKIIVAKAIADSGGTRSVIYSVATYLLRAPGISLLALAIAQAAAVAWIVTLLVRLVAPRAGILAGLVAGGGTALLTSASWYAAYVVPDILAGVAIAGIVALSVLFERTSLPTRLALVLLAAFSISAHSSHFLIAFGVTLVGLAVHFWLYRPPLGTGLRRAAWIASPVLLAVAALLGTSYVAFGQPSLAPKRYPIQLARSVADGPGAWYLRDHCATEHYAICEVLGPNPPRDVGEFLWSANGVRFRATPEQMERIRDEEGTIVRRAAMAYPGVQLRKSVSNTVLQFVDFGTGDLVFGIDIVNPADPVIEQKRPDWPALKAAGDIVVYGSFIAAIVLLF
ncbi:MAG: hypothetical protein HOP96_05190, partial [Sphingomonas sp.]|nr:hypothetical protein [Sphingomonas sp.]